MDHDVQRTIGRMSEFAERFANGLGNVTAEATDDSALVTATCDPGGRLVDIEFAPEVRRWQTYELREAVLAAANRAADAAKESLTAQVADITPGLDLGGADIRREAEAQVEKFRRLVEEQRENVERLTAKIRKSAP